MSKRPLNQSALNNGSEKGVTTYEFAHVDPMIGIRKPEKISFSKFVYNSEQNTFFGRTPINWAKLGLFYTIFYIVLGSLFAICLQGLFSTISSEYPKWQLAESLIGTNPGLGFRPIAEETQRGSLISYNLTRPHEIDDWVNNVNTFLEPYMEDPQKRKICDYNNFPGVNETCAFEIKDWTMCTKNTSYGYNTASPCVFIKLNRIFGWQPDFYSDITDLPEAMPEQLKNYIKMLKPEERKQIWISCNGQKAVDKQNILNVTYEPMVMGFPSYYYPYWNTARYLSPIVPVKFNLEPNMIVNIECRAWAKNILYSGSLRDRQGSVHIEIMVDTDIKTSKKTV